MRAALPMLTLLVACPGGDDSGKDDTGLGSEAVAECTPAHTDAVTIEGLAVSGDALEISVAYGGGCEEHTWQLCWDGAFMESDPVQAALSLGHDAHGDSCEAWLTETLSFDLSPLKQAWIDSYGGSSGTIVIDLGDQSVEYTF